MREIERQVKEYLEYCENVKMLSPRTLEHKRHTYKHLLVATKIDNLNKLDNKKFNMYVGYLMKRGVMSSTINVNNIHVVSLVKYHVEMGNILHVLKIPLVSKLKETAPKRVHYTETEINNVLELADDLQYLLIKICFETGMRLSEITNLRIRDINGCRLNFIGKGRKDREVYITNETSGRLSEFIKKNKTEDYLWVHDDNISYSGCSIRLKMKEAFIRAGYDNFYPHALRHSFGTNLQSKGANLFEIQEMLGHSDATTTQKYLHGFDGKLCELFEKYQCVEAKTS